MENSKIPDITKTSETSSNSGSSNCPLKSLLPSRNICLTASLVLIASGSVWYFVKKYR